MSALSDRPRIPQGQPAYTPSEPTPRDEDLIITYAELIEGYQAKGQLNPRATLGEIVASIRFALILAPLTDEEFNEVAGLLGFEL